MTPEERQRERQKAIARAKARARGELGEDIAAMVATPVAATPVPEVVSEGDPQSIQRGAASPFGTLMARTDQFGQQIKHMAGRGPAPAPLPQSVRAGEARVTSGLESFGRVGPLMSKHGALFGASDELAGVQAYTEDKLGPVGSYLNALSATFPHGQLMQGLSGVGAEIALPDSAEPDAYVQARDAKQAEIDAAREQAPIAATTAEMAGASVYPGGAIKGGLLRKMSTGAATGAFLGGTYGASDTNRDRGTGGTVGALFGGGVGASIPLAAPATRPLARAVGGGGARLSDAFSALIGRTGTARQDHAEKVAEDAVRRSMERSGMSMDEIAAKVAEFEDKPAVLAEVIGQDAVNALTALTRRPGSTAQKAQGMIEERFGGYYDRVRDDVMRFTGLSDDQVAGEFGEEIARRQAEAAPLYTQAFDEGGVIMSDRLQKLASSPLMQSHLRRAQQNFLSESAIEGGQPWSLQALKYWDLVKRSLDDAIEPAARRGQPISEQGETIRNLEGLRRELVSELDSLSGGTYAAAREAGGEAPRLRAAHRQGGEALKTTRLKARDVEAQTSGLSSQDVPAFQAGMAGDIIDRTNQGSLKPQRFNLPENQAKVKAGFGEKQGQKILDSFAAESELRELGARWGPRMNSVTGTVMEGNPSPALDFAQNMTSSAITKNYPGMLAQVFNTVARVARRRGYNQRQIDAIGDLLLSNPLEGLRRLGLDVSPKSKLPGGPVPPPAISAAAGSQLPSVGPSAVQAEGASRLPKVKPSGFAPSLRSDAGIAIGGAGLATAAASAGQAEAQETENAQALQGEIQATAERISDAEADISRLQSSLSLLEDPNGDPRAKQQVLQDLGFDLGPTGVDGKIGANTRRAINAYGDRLRGDIAAQRAELDTNRDRLNDLEARQVYDSVNSGNSGWREIAPYAGIAGGLALAYGLRGRGVAKSKAAARATEETANALLNAGPVSRGATGQNALNVRAANVNEFWRMGGAKDNVPFKATNAGEWRPRSKATEPSQLYPPSNALEQALPFKAADVGVIGSGAGEAALATHYMEEAKQKIVEAKADLDAVKPGDIAGLERAQARLKSAEDEYAVFLTLQRAGLAVAIGGTAAAYKSPYARPRPNVAGAEAERALVAQAIKQRRQ